MSGMKQVLASCWTLLLLSAVLLEPVLSKGGRGGSRGSSRGTSSRSSSSGTFRGGSYGGTRSRFRVAGRTSPVRVAGAAAAGAVVALTAEKWYASAYRRSNSADSSEEDVDYYNRTNYFDALMSGSSPNDCRSYQVISVLVAFLSPQYGLLLDTLL